MRFLVLTAGFVVFPLAAQAATPAELLTEARAEIAADHLYSADPLLQQVVESDDASVAEVEEALCLQSMIYYGDVFGAALVMAPLAAMGPEPHELKGLVSRQLLLARRAFLAAASSYLNTTVGGSQLAQLKVDLPPFANADVEQIRSALNDREVLAQVLAEYNDDPAAGQGLLARANQFGLHLGVSCVVPKSPGRTMEDVRELLGAGVRFDHLLYLDWLATVALDMNTLVDEPDGPDLVGLAKRCDNRILEQLGDDSESQLAKNARERAEAHL